jgi:hypothetical protein
MAGRLITSTLNDDTGVLAVQNGMRGVAKAWVNYNASTQAIRDSFNVSSVTYVNTGRYTINFTTALPNTNYSIVGSASLAGTAECIFLINNSGSYTTSAVSCIVIDRVGNYANPTYLTAGVLSS